MKKCACMVAFLFLLIITGCTSNNHSDADTSQEQPDTPASSTDASSPSAPSENTNPPQENKGNSEDEDAQQDTSPEQGPTSPEIPAEPSYPVIDASNLYTKDEYASTSIWDDRLDDALSLSGNVAKEFYAGLSFANFSPISEDLKMDLNDVVSPSIIFKASDFSYHLKLDKTAGVAMYVRDGGNAFYYQIPDGAYDSIHNYIQGYFDKYYIVPEEIEIDEDGNWDV